MSATFPVAILVTSGLAAAAAPAAAQAEAGGPPGACACAAPVAPEVAAPAEAKLPRWGIGLRMASMTLAPESTPDAEIQYGGGGLQVRYRLRPRWGLELAMDHFTERLENGDEGTRHLSSVTLAASYHFRPYARWDWYLLAGLGGTVDGDPEITDEQREASQMGHVVLGAGIERRFRRFAIGAEVRAIGMAPPADEAEDAPLVGRPPEMTVPARMEELAGGQLSVAATYYF